MPKELGIELLARLINSPKADVCIEWPNGHSSDGYGSVWYEKRLVGAHRLAYKIFYGEFPKNFACHTCDNPGCINPLHLFDGDVTANNRDGWAKGRYPKPKGLTSIYGALHKDRIFDLNKMGVSHSAIARYFNLSQPFISRILSGKRLANVS